MNDEGLRGPLRYVGGKAGIIDWQISLFPPPPYEPYVSLFMGGASDIFAKEPGNEVGNDNGLKVHTFWKVLRDKELRLAFLERCQLSPLSRKLIEELAVAPPTKDPVEMAYRFYAMNRQTFGGIGTGRKGNIAWPVSGRTRKGINESVSAWMSSIDLLPDLAERLQVVALEHDDFEAIIQRFDNPKAFFYCDPPYDLGDNKDNNYYEKPFTILDQKRLAKALKGIKGKFMICGYNTPLYQQLYKDYHFEKREVKKSASSGETKGTEWEYVWMNYVPLSVTPKEEDLFELLGTGD